MGLQDGYNVYTRQGKAKLAVQRIAGLVQKYPQVGSLHYLLGLAYYRQGDEDKAEASVRQAIALDPEDSASYTLLAGIHLNRGSMEKVKEDFLTAIDKNPKVIGNYLALEALYEKEANWEQAKKLCERARMVDPNSPILNNDLAYLYLEHGGETSVALSLALMAKEKAPYDLPVGDTLGWAYYKSGSLQFALSELRQCVRKDPDNPLYEYHLGMAYIAARQLPDAEGCLQKALKDHPDPPLATLIQGALDRLSRL